MTSKELDQHRQDQLQIESELHAAVSSELSSRRPILYHLNPDSSWLLQIPRPANATKHSRRVYFNILIDPWLRGAQTDIAGWFSKQWHAIDSRYSSISEVEALAQETEVLGDRERGKEYQEKPDEDSKSRERFIDVIVISHEFTDHCHKETLLEAHPDVPVIATKKAAELISSWNHFRTILTTPVFSGSTPDWRETSLEPLPTWVGISRVVTSKDFLKFHSAILIAFNSSAGAIASSDSDISDAAEAVIYTPHGIEASSLSIIPKASPPLSVLAFLHGLDDISIRAGQQLNLGGHNGLAAQRILNAKYWVGTHDEQKKAGGLISFLLRRHVISLGDALEAERKRRKEASKTGSLRKQSELVSDKLLEEFEDARFAQLGNGESRVLR
ncbi:MAG: hypothetical protein M1820_005784 [Bogoriella megaspora]|nr:MAG: hypothetical protein M1820_005784 [Bogoriella megaspora]